jgi:hypothetical protein
MRASNVCIRDKIHRAEANVSLLIQHFEEGNHDKTTARRFIEQLFNIQVMKNKVPVQKVLLSK